MWEEHGFVNKLLLNFYSIHMRNGKLPFLGLLLKNPSNNADEKEILPKITGSVPVVVGAPNIQEFAPSPDSILHIRELKDAESVAKTMKYLAENSDAYNHSLRYAFIFDHFPSLFGKLD